MIPENELAAEVFGYVSTQLKVGGLGGVFGFDYAALPFLYDLCEVPYDLRKDTFERLQILMGEAVTVLNQKK